VRRSLGSDFPSAFPGECVYLSVNQQEMPRAGACSRTRMMTREYFMQLADRAGPPHLALRRRRVDCCATPSQRGLRGSTKRGADRKGNAYNPGRRTGGRYESRAHGAWTSRGRTSSRVPLRGAGGGGDPTPIAALLEEGIDEIISSTRLAMHKGPQTVCAESLGPPPRFCLLPMDRAASGPHRAAPGGRQRG
jgi:hypothetical protein